MTILDLDELQVASYFDVPEKTALAQANKLIKYKQALSTI